MADEKKGLVAVKEFFGFKSLAEFKAEWQKLSDEERTWFKTEVLKVVEGK